jgi:hypothetical protein
MCTFCNTSFETEVELDNHKDKVHNVIYIPMSLEDLSHLLQFLYTGDKNLLTKSMVDTLQQYHKVASRKQLVKK